jgi:hypothetical protein
MKHTLQEINITYGQTDGRRIQGYYLHPILDFENNFYGNFNEIITLLCTFIESKTFLKKNFCELKHPDYTFWFHVIKWRNYNIHLLTYL